MPLLRRAQGRAASTRGPVFLLAPCDDAQRAIRQRTLQLQRLRRRRRQPSLDRLRRGQDHRHGLGTDGGDLGVRLGGQEGEDVVRCLALPHLPHRGPVLQIPANTASGRLSSSANHTGGLRPSGKASFSLKSVNGTTRRLSTPSQRRQCGDWTLRTLVTRVAAFQRKGRRRHGPARHDQFPPLRLVAHDRRRVVREDAGQRRQVAGGVAPRPRQIANRLLVRGERVAHA